MDQNLPIVIDTDNACGSIFGDVDDAFAISALLASPLSVVGISTVFGNTTTVNSFHNSEKLRAVFGTDLQLVQGASRAGETSDALSKLVTTSKSPVRIAALGPLTNLASCLQNEESSAARIGEVVIVGGNSVSRGFLPPIWPHEFNLTQDSEAAVHVFRSALPITICPLNIVRRLVIGPGDVHRFPPALELFFKSKLNRWFLRCLLLKGRKSFPVWDLVAAMYLIRPDLFEIKHSTATMHPNGLLRFSRGERSIKVISDFDPQKVWTAFFDLVNSYNRFVIS